MNYNFVSLCKVSVLLFFILTINSCGPAIQFLGDSYPKTSIVDVYYNENDIEKKYKTIGKMTHSRHVNYSPDRIKEKMIETVKERGGDGIIFIDSKMIRSNENEGDRLSITANVIKYI